MARLTIEDCWWTDPRRSALIRALGTEKDADWAAMRAWRLAQDFWKHAQNLIPKPLFDTLEHATHLLGVGLAELRDDGVYVRGSSAYLEWLNEAKRSGHIGGRKSAQRPRDEKGRLLSKQEPRVVQGSSKQNPSDSKPLSPLLSLSQIQNKESKGVAAANAPARRTEVSGVSQFVAAYVKSFQEKYGAGTRPDLQGKVQGEIKALLKSVPAERAIQLIQVYLQMDDRWFETKHHDFTTFANNLNKIGVALDTGQNPGGPNWGKIFEGNHDSV